MVFLCSLAGPDAVLLSWKEMPEGEIPNGTKAGESL